MNTKTNKIGIEATHGGCSDEGCTSAKSDLKSIGSVNTNAPEGCTSAKIDVKSSGLVAYHPGCTHSGCTPSVSTEIDTYGRPKIEQSKNSNLTAVARA